MPLPAGQLRIETIDFDINCQTIVYAKEMPLSLHPNIKWASLEEATVVVYTESRALMREHHYGRDNSE